jgi:hypothetical protein
MKHTINTAAGERKKKNREERNKRINVVEVIEYLRNNEALRYHKQEIEECFCIVRQANHEIDNAHITGRP